MAGQNHTVDIYTRLARLEERLENFLEDASRERSLRDARDQDMKESMEAMSTKLADVSASFERAKITGRTLIGVALVIGTIVSYIGSIVGWLVSTLRGH